MRAVLIRNNENTKQTEGYLLVFNGIRKVFECCVLELADKGNQQNVSRIPAGTYPVIKHRSPKFGPSLWVRNVPGRSEVLVHYGNYYTNTRGCILPGRQFLDINHDGLVDVTDSRRTMGELLSFCEDEFELTIIDESEK